MQSIEIVKVLKGRTLPLKRTSWLLEIDEDCDIKLENTRKELMMN